MERIRVIDSHTGGEPTRLAIAGAPDIVRDLPPATARERLRQEADHFRSAVVCEPRGSDVLVGALLCPPADPSCAAGVVFFNNVGYLGMCGHGTIGLVATLAYTGQLTPGIHRIETPVGIVSAQLHEDGRVSVRNVPAYRSAHRITVGVPGIGQVTGDVAYGGNWFFLCEAPEEMRLDLSQVDTLTDYTWQIRQALSASGITGDDGAEIDHIELSSPSLDPQTADSRNFVLCPGRAYDRSPCGTGTSAKLSCLYADGILAPGQVWRQESITGSIFEGTVEPGDIATGTVVPTITGRAYVTAEATLLFDPTDPLRNGLQ